MSDKAVSAKFASMSRPRQVLVVIAISSAIVGIVIWNFGYLVQFGSASRYPVEIATVAGYFVGLAINLGIPLVAYSLFTETKQAFTGMARAH